MGAIAASDRSDRKQLYIGVILASSAFPGIVEPISMRSAHAAVLHGDGAVTSPLLFDRSLLWSTCGTKNHVWVIANGHVSRISTKSVTSDGVVSLARFGLSRLLRQNLFTTVQEVRLQSETIASFRLFSLPIAIQEAADPLSFEAPEMSLLFLAGIDEVKRVLKPAYNRSGTAD